MTQAIVMKPFVYIAETASEDFTDWKFIFENYLALSKINKAQTTAADGAVPGATTALQNLIHAGGPTAMKCLRTFDDISVVTYAQLIEKMEAYCAPKDATLILLKFDSAKQTQDESVQEFIMRIKPIGIAGGILATAIDAEILRKVRCNSISDEIRHKAMELEMTTAKLIKWEATNLVKLQSAMSQRCDVNFVKQEKTKIF